MTIKGGGGPTPNGENHLKFTFWLFEPVPKVSWCVYNIIFQNYFQTKRILFIHNTLSSEPPLRNRIFSLRCDCYNIAKNYVAKIEPQKPMMRYVVRLQYFVTKKKQQKSRRLLQNHSLQVRKTCDTCKKMLCISLSVLIYSCFGGLFHTLQVQNKAKILKKKVLPNIAKKIRLQCFFIPWKTCGMQ